MIRPDNFKEKAYKVFSYLPSSPVAILLYFVLALSCVLGLIYSVFRLNFWLVEVDVLTELGFSSEQPAAISWMLIEAVATPISIFIIIVIVSAVGVTVEEIQKIIRTRYEVVEPDIEMVVRTQGTN